jgi:hypothetical protein
MKRLLILIGILIALIGISITLPALANYGRPRPMANNAQRAVLAGCLVTLGGGAAIFVGARKHRA